MLNSEMKKDINRNGDYKNKGERRQHLTEESCKGEWGYGI